MKRHLCLAVMVSLIAWSAAAPAEEKPGPAAGGLQLPRVFGDSMVLQQGMPVPVWGTAAPGEKVTVKFRGQEAAATADEQGRWMAKLQPLKAETDPKGADLVIAGKDRTVTLADVLVGEVWLGSGQSNMEFSTNKIDGDYPAVRLLTKDGWRPAMQKDFRTFSNLLWNFGKNLQKELGVPVGLVVGAAGGTPSGRWVAEGAMDDAEVRRLNALYKQRHADLVKLAKESQARYEEEWKEWDRQVVEFIRARVPEAKDLKTTIRIPHDDMMRLERQIGVLNGDPRNGQAWNELYLRFVEQHHPEYVMYKNYFPTRIWRVRHPTCHAVSNPDAPADPKGGAGDLFKTHIQPLIPLAIRGVVWDQGETGTAVAGVDQFTLMRALVASWRKAWAGRGGQSDFPWLYVQKPSGDGGAFDYDPKAPSHWKSAPFEAALPPMPDPNTGLWREIHIRIMTLPNTAMVTGSDLDNGIHPPDKDRYGRRTSDVALGFVYGRNVEYYGPIYDAHKVDGRKVVVKFRHVGQGLTARHIEALHGFAVAGEDRKFVWADARITASDTVEVASDQVARPVAVRYAYAGRHAWANLFNKDGLPALPFRTDNWTWPNMIPMIQVDLFGLGMGTYWWICDPDGPR